MDFSEIEEMYLKTIFEIIYDTPDSIVKTTQLAQLMGVSAASTTEMIQKLESRDMLTYISYKGCRLTPQGFNYGARIKRREALLELLLVEIIGFTGDYKSIACRMEHTVNEELELALDSLLGYPEKSVDGKKIPFIDRDVKSIKSGTILPITNMPMNSKGVISLMLVNDVDMVTLNEMGIRINSEIKFKDGKYFFDGANFKISSSLGRSVLVSLTEIGGINESFREF